MRRTRVQRVWRLLVLTLVAAMLFSGLPATAVAGERDRPERYIVLLREESASSAAEVQATAERVSRSASTRAERVFTRAVKAFTVEMTPTQARSLRSRPEVAAVVPDVLLTVDAQTVPTGIQRIGTLENDTAKIDGVGDPMGVDIAVLDTGIDVDHPDLNVVGGYDCTGSGTYDDRHGHGTHVAGIIGARDNSTGVVGVAPGARLWAVKVFSDQGAGYASWLICGIEWVIDHAGTIEVANFSGGASGSNTANCGQGTDPLHQAVCRLVDAGVPLIVAAGNGGTDAANTIPAAYPEAIAVGAIVDTDGQPGGFGPSTSYGADDTRASFSNYGSAVDLFAPGVRILSTYPGGNTALMSGTSMAAPHVAGAAALYYVQHPGASVSQVRSWLVNNGESGPWGPQPLVKVGSASSTPAPPPAETVHDVAVTALSVPATVVAGSAVTVQVGLRNEGTVSESIRVTLSANGDAVGSAKTVSLGAGATQTVSFSWTPSQPGTVTLSAEASIDATDTDPGDNRRETTMTVQSSQTRDIALSNLSAPRSLRQGQSANVSVTLTNKGSARETVIVTLTSDPANPRAGTLVVRTTVDPGQSKTVRFTWRTSSQTPAGTYRLTVTGSLEGDANPADNSVSGEITVTSQGVSNGSGSSRTGDRSSTRSPTRNDTPVGRVRR